MHSNPYCFQISALNYSKANTQNSYNKSPAKVYSRKFSEIINHSQGAGYGFGTPCARVEEWTLCGRTAKEKLSWTQAIQSAANKSLKNKTRARSTCSSNNENQMEEGKNHP